MVTFDAQVAFFAVACFFAGVVIGYFMGSRRNAAADSDDLVDAKIRAAKGEAYKDGQDSVFRDFSFDQHVYPETRGYLFKKEYVVIEERLLYRGIPLTGWMRHRCKLEEHLDEEALKLLAETATAVSPALASRRSVKVFSRRS